MSPSSHSSRSSSTLHVTLSTPSSATALKSPSSPDLSTAGGATSEGVEWRRSRLNILAVVAAAVMLVVWLVAAIWLVRVDFFLPLDYFGGLEDATGDNGEKGFFAWTNGTYNILITLVGNLTWVIIAAALAVGFSTYLRRLLLLSDGISLYTFDTLVKLSAQGLQFKLRWSALLAFAVFVIAQLYPSATQAAFGSSIARTNISMPYRLARVSSNLDPLAVTANLGQFLAQALVDEPGTTLASLTAGYLTNTSVTVFVGATIESNNPGEPLFDMSFLATDTEDTALVNISSAQQRLLASSPALRVFTTVEAFLADTTCALADFPFDPSDVRGTNFTRFDFDFPCGSTNAFYSREPLNPRARTYEANTTADFFACPDGSPTVYVFAVEPVNGTFPYAYECNISAFSALVPIQAGVQRPYNTDDPSAGLDQVDFTTATHGAVRFSTRVEVPDSFGLVKSMGEGPFRTRGMMGDDLLMLALDLIERTNGTDGRREFVEHVVETAAKLRLVQLSSIALSAGSDSDVEGLRVDEMDRSLQIEALRVHLDSLAWLAVPLILLLAVLSILPLLLTTSGRVDFTDPISTALIALNSPPDAAVHGACTGEFSLRRGREAARRANETRLWYGQQGEKGEPEHLVLVANAAAAAGLRQPVRRRAYA